jgi:hypothetical protein
MRIDDWDPVYLPDDGFPRDPLEMAIPPFPPYSYADVRRAIEDGEYEIVSVEVTETDRRTGSPVGCQTSREES